MVVKHLWIVIEHSLGDGLRLDHVIHVAVAIVVVPDVFLPKAGHRAHFISSAQIAAIPRRDLILAVGIDGEPEHQNHIVENIRRLGIGLGHQVVGELNSMLRAGDLGGMQPTVDMHDRFACPSQRAGIGVTQALHQREFLRGVLILIELG